MGKANLEKEVISSYLNIIARIYRQRGRYGYSLVREELKKEFVENYPEHREIIEKTFSVVREKIDDGRERWPSEEQIRGLLEVIIAESNISRQPAS